MAKKRPTCIDCQKRPGATASQAYELTGIDQPDDLCTVCLNFALEENEHSDGDHENNPVGENCMICRGEDPRFDDDKPARKGHSKGIAKSHTSHADCDHPRTKSARAKCRQERNKK